MYVTVTSPSHAVLRQARSDQPRWERYLNRVLATWLVAMGATMLSVGCLTLLVLCLLMLTGLLADAPRCMQLLQQWRQGTAWERQYAALISQELFSLRQLVRPSPFVAGFLIFFLGMANCLGVMHPGQVRWLPGM